MKQTVGQRIQWLLDQKSMNPKDAASYIGLSASTMYKVLRSGDDIQMSTLLKVISAFKGIRFDWVLEGTGNPFHEELDRRFTSRLRVVKLLDELKQIEYGFEEQTDRRKADLSSLIYDLGKKLAAANELEKRRLSKVLAGQKRLQEILNGN